MTIAHLGLGGNQGEPRSAMAAALSELARHPSIEVQAVSPLYRTPPWGRLDQPDFVNAVARVETGLSAPGLLTLCLEVERHLGRIRNERWGPRSIDIDLLLFGDETIEEEGIIVPHPRMTERAFVMVPLADIAPDLSLCGKTASAWTRHFAASGITRLTEDGGWWNGRQSDVQAS